MWDNNIISTSYPITNNQKIDHTLANCILPNSFQHNTVNSTTIIILPSVVKNKTKLEDILRPSKTSTYTVPSLPSQHNRILIPSARLGYKINDSYKINNKTKKILKPVSSLHIIKK